MIRTSKKNASTFNL